MKKECVNRSDVEIRFGAFADDIQKQLKKQGWTYSEEKIQVKWLRQAIEGISFLYWHDVITDKMTHDLRMKLGKHIQKKMKRLKPKSKQIKK